jgi:UDP-2,3-diacylglucosamine hydrolase
MILGAFRWKASMAGDQAPLFFISDAHLGADSPAQESIKSSRLHAFWEHVGRSGGDVVVVGDLFDFWFEFRHAIPNVHTDHLAALRHLVDSGHRVGYVAGNHDFWVGRFFREELGVHFHPEEWATSAFGARVVFRHGDGWLPGERGYRLMRGVLRNPLCIRMFQMLSPDLGFPLARWVSKQGKERHELTPQALAQNVAVARGRLQGGVDILITAHLHQVLHFAWPEGHWLVAGDWMRRFSFGVLDSSGPALYRWNDAGHHTRVEPERAAGTALRTDR